MTSVILELLRNDGSIIINKNLTRALGHEAALLLGELLSKKAYFEERELINDGWFYETVNMIELNTDLSYRKQRRAEKVLIDENILKTKLQGIPAKKYFFIVEDEENIKRILQRGEAKKRQILQKINEEQELAESENQVLAKRKNLTSQNAKVINNRSNNNRLNTYIVENEKTEKQEAIPYEEIVNYLNEKTGKQYRHTTPKTRELIKARWNEGFRLDDFKKVIDNEVLKWKNTEMETYLRPVTLFSTKFESYLNEDPDIILKMKKKEKQKEEYNIQEFFNDLEIDYIIELTGNEYNAKKRFNEYAEKYGVDKDQRTLFKEFSSWCRKLRDGERV